MVLAVAGDRYLAVDVKDVSHVVAGRQLIPLPDSPPHVAGMFMHHGHLLTVLDMGIAGGGSAVEPAGHIVVVTLPGFLLGLRVTRVLGVMRAGRRSRSTEPDQAGGMMVKVGEHRAQLVKPDQVITAKEKQVFHGFY